MNHNEEIPYFLGGLGNMLPADVMKKLNELLEQLPPWDRKNDYILEMSVSVNVKGGVEEQLRFAEYLRKWLVAMVAGWVDEREVNHVILIFVGEQGIYKTTWFNYVLPPRIVKFIAEKFCIDVD